MSSSDYVVTEWIEWRRSNSGECPVPGWVHVHFRTTLEQENPNAFIDEDEAGRPAETLRWDWKEGAHDNITKYRIVLPKVAAHAHGEPA